MNAVSWVAAMAATRHLLKRKNPQLLEWTRSRWSAWLDQLRNSLVTRAEASLIASATISCLADLELHVGLMQLLTADFNLKMVLALPTEEAARIARAQARREEWEGLVVILSEPEARGILERVPDRASLAFFPGPVVLEGELLQRVLPPPHRTRPPRENLLEQCGAFLGSSADYRAWAGGRDGVGRAPICLQRLLKQKPNELSAGNLAARLVRERQANTTALNASIDFERGRMCLAMTGGDELLVEALEEGAQPTVLVRRHGELCAAAEQLKIRAPAQLLTTSPRRIRVERVCADAGSRSTELLFNIPPARLRPWMIAAFLNRGGGGNPVIRGFAKAIGCRIAYAEDEPEQLRDIPVVWGVLRDSDRIIAQAKAQGFYYFYIDHAYFNRGHGQAYRITRNAYEAGHIRDCPADRLSALDVPLQPWRKSGREVVVCPPTEYFMNAHGCPDWLETTLATLRSVTDRPIVTREKPKSGVGIVPLAEALTTAHALVTHSSNVAIEAACLGTPVFVSPTSAAAPVGTTDLSKLEEPVYPDRAPWLAHLAYNQFSFNEICDGTAWRLLLELEEREFV